jgi:hypothetical protein
VGCNKERTGSVWKREVETKKPKYIGEKLPEIKFMDKPAYTKHRRFKGSESLFSKILNVEV